ncbi:MAG: sigma 54-dependent Fis family transcriptional regulator [Deltaproteobacteria bacterium]|nr:sigma 54-dependent Fis family transcriptional regulator [Deltaproteobacteria bacterium]
MHKGTLSFHHSGLPIETLQAKIVAGPDAGLELCADSDVITVGTAAGNDLRLSDETVSRYHVDLVRQGAHVLVCDHGSTNGTLVNQVRIERAAVPPETVLTLGRTQLKVAEGKRGAVEVCQAQTLAGLHGQSAVMRRMMALVERLAKTDTSVLVQGESGTGKELVARAIHDLSGRRGQPFVTVDCGTLSPTLIASHLFGHERGAFTGAERQHQGAFERANGGTVYLDEIGELPAEMQANLLGVLERKRFSRLGGSGEIRVNVRLVCATNRDLRADVNDGSFRLDLFYRVAVATLLVPPLRERVEDIPLLAEHFMHELGYAGRAENLVSPATMDLLCRHRWPGNVRELRNVLEATLALGEPPAFDGAVAEEEEPEAVVHLQPVLGLPYKEARSRLLDKFERHYLRDLLQNAGGNVSEAARKAEMDRTYLSSLIRKHGLR